MPKRSDRSLALHRPHPLCLALALVFAHGVSVAQTAPAPAPAGAAAEPATPVDSLETVIVTGNAGGVKKLNASYSVTSISEEQIKQANPKSTADLLKVSPGLWPESSGGQTGANIEIAGMPGGGDAPYFTVQLNGSPIYGTPTLSFFEGTSAIRLDDTVQRVEIVQGGPSVVFGDGQMGATANFILKTGTEKPSGSMGLTVGSEGLYRVDGFYGFQVAPNWYASIGGFYRESNGVRKPQFKADDGGQLTATLAHDWDSGSVTFYARALNDKNQFITPVPVIQNGTDNFSAYPGFNPLTSTYYSHAIQHVTLHGVDGNGTVNANLANGRGAKMNFLGFNVDQDFGQGWKMEDKFLYNSGDMDTNALFSGSNPQTLSALLSSSNVPAGSATATYVGGGAVDPNASVITQGWWYIHKHLTNLNNDLRISKNLFVGNTLTAGVYLSHYTMDDVWSLGNNMLMSNTPNARPITVSYQQGGSTYALTDSQGFQNYGGFNVAQNGTGNNRAVYLSDSWKVDSWLLDASVRHEKEKMYNNVCNFKSTGAGGLDNDPLTLYDNNFNICDGTYTRYNNNQSVTSWTIGANYEFNSNTSAYVRANKGGHFNDFDNGVRGSNPSAPLQTMKNIEAGFKYQSKLFYADVSIYHKKFSGLQYTPSDSSGAPLTDANGNNLTSIYGSSAKGVNMRAALTPMENLTLTLVGNYMDGHYTNINQCVPYSNVVNGNGCALIDGKQLQRQPKVHFAFTPSYRMPTSFGDVTVFVTDTYVGARTQDQSGLQQLGNYNMIDFGVVANVQHNWQVRLQGTNLTNTLGLTESNSRIFGSAAGTNGVILARPLEGREVNLQVKYMF
ncbi:MAG TPA: TonB-dependent receptor [Burkholderiaceae bacterium]|jgi:outer membrane receptor protein involved in Fe transport